MATTTVNEQVADYLQRNLVTAKALAADNGHATAFGWLTAAVESAVSDLRRTT